MIDLMKRVQKTCSADLALLGKKIKVCVCAHVLHVYMYANAPPSIGHTEGSAGGPA